MTSCTTTRLAPSPTGALHLGNARTFLVNYLLARQNNWRVLMRVEDLDGPRVKKGADQQLLEELAFLGLTWEGLSPPSCGAGALPAAGTASIVYQSQRAYAYEAALGQLAQAGMAYPCTCSRRDIALAGSAPHAEDAIDSYPGSCRGRFSSADQAAEITGRPVAWRVKVDDVEIGFEDNFAGLRHYNLARSGGDFVICKADGLAAYQLAVVVDDAAFGIDAIVRGDDLLDSTARQIHLRRLLGLTPEPRYWHLPLVIGPDGRRLAKRHGDTRLAHFRQAGCSRERFLGLLGYWCGLLGRRQETSMQDLLARFDLALLPRTPTIFCQADNAFLCG